MYGVGFWLSVCGSDHARVRELKLRRDVVSDVADIRRVVAVGECFYEIAGCRAPPTSRFDGEWDEVGEVFVFGVFGLFPPVGLRIRCVRQFGGCRVIVGL